MLVHCGPGLIWWWSTGGCSRWLPARAPVMSYRPPYPFFGAHCSAVHCNASNRTTAWLAGGTTGMRLLRIYFRGGSLCSTIALNQAQAFSIPISWHLGQAAVEAFPPGHGVVSIASSQLTSYRQDLFTPPSRAKRLPWSFPGSPMISQHNRLLVSPENPRVLAQIRFSKQLTTAQREAGSAVVRVEPCRAPTVVSACLAPTWFCRRSAVPDYPTGMGKLHCCYAQGLESLISSWMISSKPIASSKSPAAGFRARSCAR